MQVDEVTLKAIGLMVWRPKDSMAATGGTKPAKAGWCLHPSVWPRGSGRKEHEGDWWAEGLSKEMTEVSTTREDGSSLILLHRTDLLSSKRHRAALHWKAMSARKLVLCLYQCITRCHRVSHSLESALATWEHQSQVTVPRSQATRKQNSHQEPQRGGQLSALLGQALKQGQKPDLHLFEIFQKQNLTYLPFLRSEEEKHFTFNCPDGDCIINKE